MFTTVNYLLFPVGKSHGVTTEALGGVPRCVRSFLRGRVKRLLYCR